MIGNKLVLWEEHYPSQMNCVLVLYFNADSNLVPNWDTLRMEGGAIYNTYTRTRDINQDRPEKNWNV